MRFLLAFMLLYGFHAAPLMAAEPVKLGSFGKWLAYSAKVDGQQTCYMMLRPLKQNCKTPEAKKAVKGKQADKKNCLPPEKRSDAYLMITLRPSDSMNPVISYRSGYIFKQGSEVILKTGPKPYNLFTDKDQAWARSSAIDIAITSAIRKAKNLLIEGQSNQGGKSTDSFDADGAEKAYKAIARACGVI